MWVVYIFVYKGVQNNFFWLVGIVDKSGLTRRLRDKVSPLPPGRDAKLGHGCTPRTTRTHLVDSLVANTHFPNKGS